MMIDFLAPYLKSVGKIREQVDFIRNFQFADRAKLEELEHQFVRFKRYDEFFIECNRKINNHEAEIRSVEKKLSEEIHAVETKKQMMEFQIASFQADNNNFRNINESRSEEIRDFRDTIDKMRKDLNNDLQKGSGAMFEEIVMQQDRVRELVT